MFSCSKYMGNVVPYAFPVAISINASITKVKRRHCQPPSNYVSIREDQSKFYEISSRLFYVQVTETG